MPTSHDGGAHEPLGILDAELLAPALLHELRQPLTGADAAATLLERVLPEWLHDREEWQLLRRQIARIAEVMSGYEELFRAGEADPAAFEVGPVVSRAVDLLAHRVRPLSRRFALLPGDGPARGYGAPSALVHAATNLLSNALDAVEAGHRDARVAVRVIPTAAAVEVRVSDEGVGIPERHRARLFEPRFSTKAPGRGSGLGLHLSRQLMARFGGDVSLIGADDPLRLPWAVTEFCIRISPPPRRAP
jgi:signal transduction histidine kinase